MKNFPVIPTYFWYFNGDFPHGAGPHRPQGKTYIVVAHSYSLVVSMTTGHAPFSRSLIAGIIAIFAVQLSMYC